MMIDNTENTEYKFHVLILTRTILFIHFFCRTTFTLNTFYSGLRSGKIFQFRAIT